MIVVVALVYACDLITCEHREQSTNITQFSVERLDLGPSDKVAGVSPINVNMAAEPWLPTRSLEVPDHDSGKRQKTVSEQMDEDLERMEQSAATASSARQPSAAEAANATSTMRQPATRHAMQREVALDPRLLTKPGECPTERGTTWKLWRTKLEGWFYGVSM